MTQDVFHPFTFSDVGFGTCVPNDAHQHAFDNVAYANAPASASGEPCQTIPRGFPPHMSAQVKARLTAQSHAADCEPRNPRLVAFGLLGPEATSVTYRTAHGTATIRPHGPDGAYLIVEPVDPAICGTQCGYAGGGGTAMSLPVGLIATITYRDAPTCHGPPLTHDLATLQRFGQCRDVGYVAPPHPKVTEADVASPVHVQPMPARHYCIHKGIYQPNVLRIPCDGRIPNGYFQIKGGASQLMVYISWIARQPVTNVNDSTYSFQVTNPRHCGGGEGGNNTQTVIRAGTRDHPGRRGLEPLRRHLPGHGRLRTKPRPGRPGRHRPAAAGRPGHISRRALLDRGALINAQRTPCSVAHSERDRAARPRSGLRVALGR